MDVAISQATEAILIAWITGLPGEESLTQDKANQNGIMRNCTVNFCFWISFLVDSKGLGG